MQNLLQLSLDEARPRGVCLLVTSWTSAFLHGFPLPTRATNANVSSRRVITKRSHPRRRVGGASTFVAVVVFHAVQRGDDIDDNVMEQSLHCNVTVALNRRICKTTAPNRAALLHHGATQRNTSLHVPSRVRR